METVPAARSAASVPWYRDVRVLAWLSQAVFALGVLGFAWLLVTTMLENLRRQGIPISFAFLPQAAGFGISEGLPFDPAQSYLMAFLVGVVNTLRVAFLGIGLATLLGLVLGIARLSRNWLLERLATLYVETVRNVPLLLWLVFLYAALRETLPRLRESLSLLGGTVYVSNRGMALPWLATAPSAAAWLPWLILGLVGGLGLWSWQAYTGQRGARRRAVYTCLGVWGLGWVVTWVWTSSPPVLLSLPSIAGFTYEGGLVLSLEFTALLGGLVLYTASFIAEIVRAGVLAVHRGQREAAQALGLSEAHTFWLVIFPQALRVIIPPLINQYLNLTKNSSLAIAVGYPDLFSVALTINNQTGQAIPFVVLIMLAYLSMSLGTSFILNRVNQRLTWRTR